MSKEKKMVELYRGDTPVKLINTQYGEIPYLEWLEKEKERILTKSPERVVEIRKKANGYVHLWVDDIGEDVHAVYREGNLSNNRKGKVK